MNIIVKLIVVEDQIVMIPIDEPEFMLYTEVWDVSANYPLTRAMVALTEAKQAGL